MLFPDLSEWQPQADLAGIRQHTLAVILRVAYGADHKDLYVDQHRTQVHKAGFEFIGLYQYIVSSQPILDQARAFCKWVGTLQPGEIPIVDIEEGAGDQSTIANLWFGYVDAHFGLDKLPLNQRSWIYSGASFAESNGLVPIFSSERRGWIAQYTSAEPTIPHTLWQSTNGTVGSYITQWPGAGYCDTNVFKGTIDELATMAWHPQEEEMTYYYGDVAPNANKGQVVVKGSVSEMALFCDFSSPKAPNRVRVAVLSASKGYSQIFVEELNNGFPAYFGLQEKDVLAVSFSRTPEFGEGSIAYMLH